MKSFSSRKTDLSGGGGGAAEEGEGEGQRRRGRGKGVEEGKGRAEGHGLLSDSILLLITTYATLHNSSDMEG